jgi:lipopolysaccharide export LptBFGC system permease protein LptF
MVAALDDMSLATLAPILLLAAVAITYLTPRLRQRRGVRIIAGVVALCAVVAIFYGLGAQAGRDAAQRDNRADARALAPSVP